MVPCTLGIHHGDRSPLAYPEAVSLGPKYTAFTIQAELLQPRLQKLPRFYPFLILAAFGFGLIRAEKYMSLYRFYMQLLSFFTKSFSGVLAHLYLIAD